MSAPSLPTEQDQAGAGAAPKEKGIAAFALRAALFAILIGATLAAIIAFVPDKNNYAQAMAQKHARIAAAPGRKIVLVGGSNIPFGTDSAAIEQATGCYTVDMGLDGYLGMDFMLKEAAPYIKAGDIVVIAPEFDSYVKPIGARPEHQLGYVRAYPPALAFMPWKQRVQVLAGLPTIASGKAFRLVDDTVRALQAAAGHPDIAWQKRDAVSNFANFDKYGDEVDHLDAPWPYGRHGIWDLTNLPIDPEIIPLLVSYSKEMRARGAVVMISHTPSLRAFYRRHEAGIQRIQGALKAEPDLVVPRGPEQYVLDETMFFDSVYHLNRAGVRARTALLIDDIVNTFPKQAQCRADAEANQGAKTPGAAPDARPDAAPDALPETQPARQ